MNRKHGDANRTKSKTMDIQCSLYHFVSFSSHMMFYIFLGRHFEFNYINIDGRLGDHRNRDCIFSMIETC